LDFPEDLDLKLIVGRALARYRNDVALSQEKLAEIAGLERGYISMLERGLRMPTLETVFRLCRGLRVKPSQIVKEIEQVISGR